MPRTAKKDVARVKAPTVYQPGDSVTIWYRRGLCSPEPDEILHVERCNQRTVKMSDGKEWPVSSGNIKPTQPGDLDRIALCVARREIGFIESSDLDKEATFAIVIHVKAFRERKEKRRRAITTAIRCALIDGPKSLSDLHSAASRCGTCSYDSITGFIAATGAVAHETSRQHQQVYVREATDKDRFDNVLLGVFLSKRTPTMRALMIAISKAYKIDPADAEEQIAPALERMGAIRMRGFSMGHSAQWQLQPSDKD